MSYELDTYNDPDVINAQFGNAALVQNPLLINQLGGAVTSIAGALGPSVLFATSGSGLTLGIAGAANTVTFTINGAGGLAVLDAGAAVANTATVASAAYVQTEAQAVINKLNDLLNSLRAAGIIAT